MHRRAFSSGKDMASSIDLTTRLYHPTSKRVGGHGEGYGVAGFKKGRQPEGCSWSQTKILGSRQYRQSTCSLGDDDLAAHFGQPPGFHLTCLAKRQVAVSI